MRVNNKKMIADMAEKEDVQIWIERIGDDDEMAIIIKDGMVNPSPHEFEDRQYDLE